MVIAVGFACIGAAKFDGAASSMWVRIFAQIGLGQWFRIFTGVIVALREPELDLIATRYRRE